MSAAKIKRDAVVTPIFKDARLDSDPSSCDDGADVNDGDGRRVVGRRDGIVSSDEQWNCLFRHNPQSIRSSVANADAALPKEFLDRLDKAMDGCRSGRASELVHAVWRLFTAPESAGGLGIANDTNWMLSQRKDGIQSPARVFASRKASCIEYALFLIECFNQLGIPAKAVDVARDVNGADRFGNHVAVEVEVEGGKKIVLDPIYAGAKSTGFDIHHKRTLPMTERELMAHVALSNATCFEKRGARSNAMQQVELAESLAPNSPTVVFTKGVFYLERGDYAGAVAQLRRYCAMEPRDYDRGWMNLASALMRGGGADEALDIYMKAARLAADDPDKGRLALRRRYLRDIEGVMREHGRPAQAEEIRAMIERLKG